MTGTGGTQAKHMMDIFTSTDCSFALEEYNTKQIKFEDPKIPLYKEANW